ncbi:hypothetical protein V8B97DRAFT_1874592, partial [Scleroderma yunnanense]
YLCDEGTHCGEVQYFTRLAVTANDGSWDFTDIAVIHMYSAPDKDLLQLSNHIVLVLQLLDTISIIQIKQIIGIIVMISQEMTLPLHIQGQFYCMMEGLGYDVSSWEVPYSVYHEAEDNDNGIDVKYNIGTHLKTDNWILGV